jgi:diaminopropionate ammonia-lyase
MLRYTSNPYFREQPCWASPVAEAFESTDILELHRSIPEYQPTPLAERPDLARDLGVGRVLVKDEGHRFGLKAFKALGAAYACYRFLREYLQKHRRNCPPATGFYRTKLALHPSELTLCTATDGNHGRGVAWVARKLEQKAVIYMPSESATARIDNIRKEGAEVVVVDGTYDEAVRQCMENARAGGWQIISDTSWPGYERIPRWIMAGYLTMFREIEAALEPDVRIDSVIVQGGVGALAGAAAWYFRRESRWPNAILISVEPVEAACLLESISSPAGEPVQSRGRQDSIMAGLNCGFPSPAAWPLIKEAFNLFLAVSDDFCLDAMRRFYYPSGSGPRIVSGESGAAGLAALLALAKDESAADARTGLDLGVGDTVLLINTEADTDPIGFQRCVLQNQP